MEEKTLVEDRHSRTNQYGTQLDTKFMVIVAVSLRREHYFELLNVNECVNAERYIEFLARMEAHFMKLHNPILPENMRLQHDNATHHTAQLTQKYIEGRNTRIIRHPTYSPDLNLCDRYVFTRLEASRSKWDFNSKKDIEEFLSCKLPEFTAERMNKAPDNLVEHLGEVISNGGIYITG